MASTRPDRLALLDGDALAAFVVFAEELNFTHAAARLHVSQPALHARIKRLGEALDLSLYRREGRRLVLTRSGEELLGFARELADRTQTFLGELRGDEGHTPVVLASGEGSFLYLLGDAIRRFVRAKHAPLHLLTRNRDRLLVALRSGEAQLGVTVLDEAPEDLDATPLLEVDQQLVVPRKHPLAACEGPVDLAELDGARMIVAPRGRPHRESFAQAMRAKGASFEAAVEVHGWPAMIHCVRLGLGLAIVNGTVAIPRGMVARAIPALPSARYFLVEARYLSAAARSLASIIRDELTDV